MTKNRSATKKSAEQYPDKIWQTDQFNLAGPPQSRNVPELFEHPQQIHHDDGSQCSLGHTTEGNTTWGQNYTEHINKKKLLVVIYSHEVKN